MGPSDVSAASAPYIPTQTPPLSCTGTLVCRVVCPIVRSDPPPRSQKSTLLRRPASAGSPRLAIYQHRMTHNEAISRPSVAFHRAASPAFRGEGCALNTLAFFLSLSFLRDANGRFAGGVCAFIPVAVRNLECPPAGVDTQGFDSGSVSWQ